MTYSGRGCNSLTDQFCSFIRQGGQCDALQMLVDSNSQQSQLAWLLLRMMDVVHHSYFISAVFMDLYGWLWYLYSGNMLSWVSILTFLFYNSTPSPSMGHCMIHVALGPKQNIASEIQCVICLHSE